MFLVHQAIEKSPLFVLLFSVAVVAVIAANLSQVEDPFTPVGIGRVQSLITIDF
jgi:hypothetical protein